MLNLQASTQSFFDFMTEKIRWGILGCGKIAAKFAADLRLVKEASLVAVASTDEARGKQFAELYGATNVYTSYETLAASNVDVIYIATPHGFHYEHAMLCLSHYKAVLCEKAFALNAGQAKQMVAKAVEKNVFLMEAFWTKFLPQYKKVIELINAGTIGEIRWLQADFGFKAAKPTPQRLYDPLLGGGALLDIGIYPVFMAQSILGKPIKIDASIIPYETGVDEQCCITLTHNGGAISSLSSSFAVDTPVHAIIAGTEGRIEMHNRFHNASSRVYVVTERDILQEQEVYRQDGFGYQFEAQHVTDCLMNGLVESPVMTHEDTVELMETLDAIRKVCGIKYAADDLA
jgi:predicted dehydrogenase